MFFAPNPGILSAGASTEKTYAEFQAHIATLATSGIRSWAAVMSVGSWRTTVGSFSGFMTGSTWLSFTDDSSSLARCVQHGLPSLAEVTNQSGRELYFRSGVYGSEVVFTGKTRNGYTSDSYNDGDAYNAYEMLELIYWDGVQAQRMQPSLGLGPTPYDW